MEVNGVFSDRVFEPGGHGPQQAFIWYGAAPWSTSAHWVAQAIARPFLALKHREYW